MAHFRLVHEFDTDPTSYWKIFFHVPYNAELYKRIGVKERRVIEQKEDGPVVTWTVKIMPERDLPGVVKKIVGGDLGYIERSTFYRDKNYGDVHIEPTLMKEKTKIFGKYILEPIGEKKLRRVWEGDIHVSLPLVGGKIEKVIIEDMTKSYEAAAACTREWIAKGGVP
jgi:hypothetical protein